MKADERRCPKCAETIKKAAVKCKHCGHEFSASELEAERKAEAQANKAAGIGCLVILGVLVLVVSCSAIFGGDSATTSSETAAQSAKDDEPSDVAILSQFQVGAKAKMRESLKDPGSAKYEDVYAHKLSGGNYVFCGRVNAKNGFGGYNGFERFISSPAIAATESMVDDFPKVWEEMCVKSQRIQKVWF